MDVSMISINHVALLILLELL
uniref:Uncharacterized protein n=1 Tax=Anguilla anguilla TaxID=7936 RepID=A0A0E9RJL1_ANGAN